MADPSLVGADKPAVYVLARDKREAHAWAHANKPGRYPKYVDAFHGAHVALGLNLRDETVYVLNGIAADVHAAWVATGARLVFL